MSQKPPDSRFTDIGDSLKERLDDVSRNEVRAAIKNNIGPAVEFIDSLSPEDMRACLVLALAASLALEPDTCDNFKAGIPQGRHYIAEYNRTKLTLVKDSDT